jgi:hypothetical protein
VKAGEQALEIVEYRTNDECHLCNREGDLVICESCPKTYHRNCVNFFGSGDFNCNMCKLEQAGNFNEILATATCSCCKKTINTVERQLAKETVLKYFTAHSELIPLRCSICRDYIHFKNCVDVPLYLVLSGGIYQNKTECTHSSIELRKKVADEIEACLKNARNL